MKRKKVFFKCKGKEFNFEVGVCNSFEKFSGLMFTKKENASALLFEFKKPVRMSIHSLFVFFPFVAIWFDDQNKIIDLKFVDGVRFSVSPKKSFSKLIEIPLNKKYSEIVKLLVED